MNRSPVTPGRDKPWLIFVGAAAAALIAWTVQQDDIALEADDSEVAERASTRAPVETRARVETGNLMSIFSSDDYPASAIRRNEQGLVAVSFRINRRGRVDHCSVVQSSQSVALDEVTCRIIERRARYTPARDARGRRVSETTFSRVQWVLPDDTGNGSGGGT